jgi:hypothetical protein
MYFILRIAAILTFQKKWKIRIGEEVGLVKPMLSCLYSGVEEIDLLFIKNH